MKKILSTFLWGAVIASSLVVAGCAKEYNDSELRNKISDLDSRVSTLEEQVKKLNDETIPGIKNLISALQEKLTVTKVQKNETDGSYTIYFSDGTTVSISNGPKGETGPAPVMGVQLVDGVYCWTVNGQLLKDADNNPVPVHGKNGENGKDGKDGATPVFRSTTDGLEYSIDGGQTWIPVPVAEGSVPPITFTETETSVIFKLADGTTFELAKELDFSIAFTIPSNTSVMTGETIYVGYTLAGVAESDVTEVGILTATPGFEAVVEPYAGQNDAGIISITNNDENANIPHKVYVFAANGKGKTDIKGLSFSSSTIKAVLSVTTVPAAGGSEVVLDVKANEDYTVSVSEDATSWLSVADPTRAIYEDKLAVTVAENTTNEYRSGTITLTSKTSGEVLQEIDVLQAPVSTVATSLASVAVLPDNTNVTVYNVSTVAASDTKAIITDGTDKIYVVANGLYAEGVFDFTGTKKTDADGLTYIDVKSLQMKMEQEAVILDPHENFSYYAAMVNGVRYAYNVISGTLEKDGEAFVVSDNHDAVHVIADASADLGLEALVGKKVNLKGWAINAKEISGGAEAVVNLIATEVSEIVPAEETGWAISFESSDTDVIKVTSSLEDKYAVYVATEASVLEQYGSLENYAAIFPYIAVDDMQYTFWYYNRFYGYTYDQIYEVLVASGSSDTEVEIEYGKHYVILVGVDEDYGLTGKFAIQAIEKVSPYGHNKYEDYLGEYTFTNAAGKQVWTLSEKVNGESYTISGLGGITADNVPGGELGVAVFDPVTGLVSVSNQILGSWDNDGTACTTKLVAVWYSGSSTYSNESYMSDPTVFTFGIDAEGGVDLSIKSDSYGPLEGIQYLFDVEGASQFGRIGTDVKFANSTLVKGVVESEAKYEDFLGEWTCGKKTWNIAEDVAGESYTITGIAGQPEGITISGVFEDKTLKIYEAALADDWYLSGIFAYGSKQYLAYGFNTETPAALFTGELQEDGTVTLLPGACDYGAFTSFIFVNKTSEEQSAVTSLPGELNHEEIDLIYTYKYTQDDLLFNLTMDELTGKEWDVYAVPGNGSEWYQDRRDYLGKATATSQGTVGGEDLVTISGLSYVYGEIYGFDDAVLFDLYSNILYCHANSPASFDFNGTTLYAIGEWINGDFDVISSNYSLIGGYVEDGIIALVNYKGSDGVIFNAYTDEACTDLFSPIWAEKMIILVDPEVYPTPEQVEMPSPAKLSKSIKNFNKVKGGNLSVKEVLPETFATLPEYIRRPAEIARPGAQKVAPAAKAQAVREPMKLVK